VPRERWSGGDDYEAWIGRWSRKVAPRFIDWLAIPSDARWLDLGCGTGALTAAIIERAHPTSVVSVDPSADFVDVAARLQTDERVRFAVADASALPVETGSVDVVVSGLVLNFVPDIAGGLREMRRVVTPDGTVAAYVWDYAGRMDLIRRFFDAAIAVDTRAAAGTTEGIRFPICSPGPLLDAFEGSGGFTAVDVHFPIDVPTHFATCEYWCRSWRFCRSRVCVCRDRLIRTPGRTRASVCGQLCRTAAGRQHRSHRPVRLGAVQGRASG
jgi:SAM-dependent methyltransferase